MTLSNSQNTGRWVLLTSPLFQKQYFLKVTKLVRGKAEIHNTNMDSSVRFLNTMSYSLDCKKGASGQAETHGV